MVIEPNEHGEIILKMKVGGHDKNVVWDTGYNKEIFVDRKNFDSIPGEVIEGTGIDAHKDSSTIARKKDVEVEFMGIKVKKTICAFKSGGNNLAGIGFFPNFKGTLTVNYDAVEKKLTITPVPEEKKPEKPKKGGFYFVKVPVMVPREDIVGTSIPAGKVEDGEEEEHVPLVAPKESVKKVDEDEEEEEHVPLVAPSESKSIQNRISSIERELRKIKKSIE